MMRYCVAKLRCGMIRRMNHHKKEMVKGWTDIGCFRAWSITYQENLCRRPIRTLESIPKKSNQTTDNAMRILKKTNTSASLNAGPNTERYTPQDNDAKSSSKRLER
eukprot:1110340_1